MNKEELYSIIEAAITQLHTEHPELEFTLIAVDGEYAAMVTSLDPEENLALLENAADKAEAEIQRIMENN